MLFQPGALVDGRYLIEGVHAEGSSGLLYRATLLDTVSGVYRGSRSYASSSCALKVVYSFRGEEDALISKIQTYSSWVARANSPNILAPRAVGFDRTIDSVYWVANWVHGRELSAVVGRLGRTSFLQTHALLQQICQTLACAHRVQFAHGYLNTSRIFVAPTGNRLAPVAVLIRKFGAISPTGQEHDVGGPDVSLEQCLWMAPELARGGTLTPQCDVWALALLAFYCLTGRHYWVAAQTHQGSIHDWLREVLLLPLVPPSARAREFGVMFPGWLDDWFSQCLCREAAQRYQDINVAGQAILSCLQRVQPMIGHDATQLEVLVTVR
jgi:serine/threonine protein kinase